MKLNYSAIGSKYKVFTLKSLHPFGVDSDPLLYPDWCRTEENLDCRKAVVIAKCVCSNFNGAGRSNKVHPIEVHF